MNLLVLEAIARSLEHGSRRYEFGDMSAKAVSESLRELIALYEKTQAEDKPGHNIPGAPAEYNQWEARCWRRGREAGANRTRGGQVHIALAHGLRVLRKVREAIRNTETEYVVVDINDMDTGWGKWLDRKIEKIAQHTDDPTEDDRHAAIRDAAVRGTGFLVDGKHVDAESVTMYRNPALEINESGCITGVQRVFYDANWPQSDYRIDNTDLDVRERFVVEYIEQRPGGRPEYVRVARNTWPEWAEAVNCDPAPIPMLLFCPNCGQQHIDKADAPGWPEQPRWMNPPHRSHLCGNCGHTWRPADVATTGVASLKTKGKNDDSPVRR